MYEFPQITYLNSKCASMNVGDEKHIEIDEVFNLYLKKEPDDKYTGWVYYVSGASPVHSFIRTAIEEIVKDCYRTYIMKDPCNDTYEYKGEYATVENSVPCDLVSVSPSENLDKNKQLADALKDFIYETNPSDIVVESHDDYTEVRIFKSVTKICEEKLGLDRQKAIQMAKAMISTVLRSIEVENFIKSQSFSPPESVASNAKRGLELREKYGRGGTEVGVARARDLSNKKNVSYDTIKRMVSFFARHEQNKDSKKDNGEPGNGAIAWKLWGGDSGKKWAESIHNKVQNVKKSKQSRKVSTKIKKLMDEGKPHSQAIAIALEMDRRGEL